MTNDLTVSGTVHVNCLPNRRPELHLAHGNDSRQHPRRHHGEDEQHCCDVHDAGNCVDEVRRVRQSSRIIWPEVVLMMN